MEQEDLTAAAFAVVEAAPLSTLEGSKVGAAVDSQGSLGVGPGMLQALVEQKALSRHMPPAAVVVLAFAGGRIVVRIALQTVEADLQAALVVLQLAETRVER